MTVPARHTSVGEGTTSSSLEDRLAHERAGLLRKSVAAVVLGVISVGALAITVGAIALGGGRWMSLPRAVPFALWALAVAGAWGVVIWLRGRSSSILERASLANTIEVEQGLRAGSLRGALEVGRSGTLGSRAAADVSKKLGSKRLAPGLSTRLAKALGVTAIVAIATLAAASLAAARSNDGFSAVVHPVKAFRGTLLSPLSFERLPAAVPRGMPVTARVHAVGRQAVTFSRRAAGEAWRDTVILVDASNGMASLSLGAVRAPVSIRVADGRAPVAEATIAVADRGWIGDVALIAQFPAYLQRSSESLEPVPPLRVPRGTRVKVSAILRGGARDAMLTDGRDTLRFLSDASTTASASMSASMSDGAAVSATIPLDHDGTWTWIAASTPRENAETLPPELPDALAFTVIPDRAPQVIIESPRTDTIIGTSGAVPIIVMASDDHGVSVVGLQIWREAAAVEGTPGKRERIDIAQPSSPIFEGGVTIPLEGRDLQPGDRIFVVAVATDDSPWNQVTESPAVVLRVPSLSDQRSMARDLADSLAAKAAQLAAQERRLQQNTSDASRNRELNGANSASNGASKAEAQKNQMSFSAAEKTKQLAKEQQQMGAKVDSLRKMAKELEDRLKSAGALDTSLADRMRDVQRMLREAMTPEMQKQLQQLEKNTDRLSGTEAQQSLEQLAAQQKQMRDQLEKSAEMLKRAALEGAMGTLRDEAKDLATEQKQLADALEKSGEGKEGNSNNAQQRGANDPKSLADRSRDLEKEVEQLAKRLEEAGAKEGASQTRDAKPMVSQAAEAMNRAAQKQASDAAQRARENQPENSSKGEQSAGQQGEKGEKQASGDKNADAMAKAMESLKDEREKNAAGAGSKGQQGGASKDASDKQGQKPGENTAGKSGEQSGDKSTQQQGGNSASKGEQGGGSSGAGSGGGSDARQASNQMQKAAQQLSDARDSQIDAWKTDLSQQLDQSINETMQLARQQSELEQRAREQGAQGMQGEQGAVQQGVKQAAERLEKAGRSSSLLSQRSQRAMSEAQRRVSDATEAMGNAAQPGGSEATQNAMKDASEALNQALSSLVRDRERVNNAGSASGFQEMMDQLKQLAQQQSALNGQMQGLQMLPGGAQGQQARQQGRVLARQQREVAKTLQDVSDIDATGRTDALAKEAQSLAQQMERSGVDPSVAARQQQLYRRLLDAGRFLEQDEKDDQGPREAKTGGAMGRNNIEGPQSGRAGNKFAPPTWNDLRGLDPEERRLVIEYFRRLNGSSGP